eukprot:g24174.t1
MDEDEPIESNSTGRDPGVDGSPGAWRMAEYQQHQNIEAAALRNRLEAAVREVDRHTAAADALQRRCEDLESRLQKPEEEFKGPMGSVSSQDPFAGIWGGRISGSWKTSWERGRAEPLEEITALRGEMEKRASQQLTQVEAKGIKRAGCAWESVLKTHVM